MFDINKQVNPSAEPPEETLAKAHPAQELLKRPGWNCGQCNHINPITAPFCKRCEDNQ